LAYDNTNALTIHKKNHFILRYFSGQKALSIGILESKYIVAYS